MPASAHGFALLSDGDAESSADGTSPANGYPVSPPPSTAVERTDADLLRLIAAGDRQAFSELYDRFARPLFSFAVKTLGNAGDAEDLVQEVFVELWSKAAEFDARRAQPFTWAVTIVRNKAIDRLRSRTRRSAILEKSADDIVSFSLGSESPDLRQQAWSTESAKLVRDAFHDLPEDQRTPLALAFFEGLSQTQIAERLSQPLGTIKARIRRGLFRLRDQLAGKL